jgi:predicted amidohydrolase
MKFKAAAVQTGPIEGDPDGTLQRSLDWLGKAGAQDVKLAVFPELCYPGYNPLLAAKAQPERYEELIEILKSLAEPIPGPATDRLAEKAIKYGMHIVFGIMEKGEGDNLHNSSVLIDAKGEILTVNMVSNKGGYNV